MSAVCTCYDLSAGNLIDSGDSRWPICGRCGNFHSQKHGSRPVGEKFDVDKAVASGMVVAGPNWRELWNRPIRRMGKVEPNDPCPCGSGRKAKKCCL